MFMKAFLMIETFDGANAASDRVARQTINRGLLVVAGLRRLAVEKQHWLKVRSKPNYTKVLMIRLSSKIAFLWASCQTPVVSEDLQKAAATMAFFLFEYLHMLLGLLDVAQASVAPHDIWI